MNESISRKGHVCPWQCVWWFDNWLRPLLHRPERLFGPHLEPGMTILDVGCGRGFSTLEMAKRVGEQGVVHAVDVQPEMLEMVNGRAQRAGLADRIVTHLATPTFLDLPDDLQLDFAIAFWMVHEVPEVASFLDQIRAALHDDGRFLIIEPRIHVKKSAFDELETSARQAAWIVHDRPAVRFSRAVLLGKG